MSNLVGLHGQPIESKQAQPEGRALPPQLMGALLDLADAVLHVERQAFESTKGDLRKKMEAADATQVHSQKVLTREEMTRGAVQICPHLFAKVPLVAASGPSRIVMHTRDIRAAFWQLMRNGYVGIPILGIGPRHVLEQLDRDRKE